jgi:hypothetical protein
MLNLYPELSKYIDIKISYGIIRTYVLPDVLYYVLFTY